MRTAREYLGAAAFILAAGTTAEAQTVTLWSHWADEKAKVAFVEEAARRFEAKHPGAKVEITWYQKGPLNTALQSALRAGRGPDVFYADPFQVEYIENGLIQPLDGLLATDTIEDWAKAAWTHDGKLYACRSRGRRSSSTTTRTWRRRSAWSWPPAASSTPPRSWIS